MSGRTDDHSRVIEWGRDVSAPLPLPEISKWDRMRGTCTRVFACACVGGGFALTHALCGAKIISVVGLAFGFKWAAHDPAENMKWFESHPAALQEELRGNAAALGQTLDQYLADIKCRMPDKTNQSFSAISPK